MHRPTPLDFDPDVVLVTQFYEAFARGDIQRAALFLHPTIEWSETGESPDGVSLQLVGPEAVSDHLAQAREVWADLSSESTAHRRGETVVMVRRLTGHLHDGQAREMTTAEAFTVVDGQITRMRGYRDPAEALS